MKSVPEYPIRVSCRLVHRFPKLGIAAYIVLSAGFVLILSWAGNAFAQAGSPAAHINVAPPTRTVSPRTGSVAPPTGAFGHLALTPHLPLKHNGRPSPQNTPAGIAYYPYFYPVAVPYADDADAESGQAAEQPGGADAQVPGDDWRAPEQDADAAPSYSGPMRPYDTEQQDYSIPQVTVDPPRDVPDAPTTLVFKDGHQVEVENYAIVGQTLYDLTSGHPRKVALASLDLEATEKENDDRGIVFQVPPSSRGTNTPN